MERMSGLGSSGLLDAGLADQVSKILFSDSPDLGAVQARLEVSMRLTPDDARLVLYLVVRRLNASLFPAVTSLELVLTEGCNLACAYCFEKEMLGHRKMSLDVARAAVDVLFDYSRDEDLLSITHFGGEPTLNFPAVQAVTHYARSKAAALGKSVRFGMTTNGVALNEEIVEYLAGQEIDVLLSVDGLGPTHDRYRLDKRGNGTFDRVLGGLTLLKRVQPWISVKMTVMPVNASALFTDVAGLYELGANEFIIGYASGVKWSAAEMEVYGEQLSKVHQWYKGAARVDLRIPELDTHAESGTFGCRAGNSSITVTVDGEISPCAKVLALNKAHLLAKLGDIRYGLTHLRNRQSLVGCEQLRSACDAVGIATEFEGGCFAENFEDNHDLFRPSLQGHAFALVKRSACSGCASCKKN